MPGMVSLPSEDNSDSEGFYYQYGLGYFETTNYPLREVQEDSITFYSFDNQELDSLSPEDIAHRLWTCYQLLDNEPLASGTTVTTTIYKDGYFITSNLSDSVAFVVVYDLNKNPIGVLQLNNKMHKPTDPEEYHRIISVGGQVRFGRVEGNLNLARSIGDTHYKNKGMTADASISIIKISQLAEKFQIKTKEIGLIQLVVACDGFTDGAGYFKSKSDYELYLLNALKELHSPANMPEHEIAKFLVKTAQRDGSADNISVAVLSINSSVLLSIQDGHCGKEASCKVAENLVPYFLAQCKLTQEEYAAQPKSVHKNKSRYNEDNPASAIMDGDLPGDIYNKLFKKKERILIKANPCLFNRNSSGNPLELSDNALNCNPG